MQRLACIISLVAALFLASACDAVPEKNQPPPVSVTELDRFLRDSRAVIKAVEKAAERCGAMTREEGRLVLKRAREKAIRDLGWTLGRFNDILGYCRKALARQTLENSADKLAERAGTALGPKDRARIQSGVRELEARLLTVVTRLESRTTAAERAFLARHLDTLGGGNNAALRP
ncbi:MAG: hypothetical protein H0S80_08610 [Desulfovibrionaceae bacterium]|nr:hypothetical protein [Desulfovibrionaceae bacterium]